MGKYVLNHGSGKLHKETCFLVKEAFHSEKAFRIDEVLEGYPKKVGCCNRCLKSDEQAQSLVEAHNQQVK